MNHTRAHMGTGMDTSEGTGIKDTADDRRHHHACKSVLVATDVFDWLREFQLGTYPRLELRYLVEAAVELVRGQTTLATQLERQARERLKRHLNSLTSVD